MGKFVGDNIAGKLFRTVRQFRFEDNAAAAVTIFTETSQPNGSPPPRMKIIQGNAKIRIIKKVANNRRGQIFENIQHPISKRSRLCEGVKQVLETTCVLHHHNLEYVIQSGHGANRSIVAGQIVPQLFPLGGQVLEVVFVHGRKNRNLIDNSEIKTAKIKRFRLFRIVR